MAQGQQEAQGAGLGEGLPEGLELFSPFPFKGMDVKGSPTAIDDASFAWLENVMWIGQGQLALLADNNPTPLYTAPAGLNILAYSFFVLGGAQFMAVFQGDGSAVQVAIPGGGVTQIGPPGTFLASPSLPATATYAALYLLIATSNGYFAWDGTVLYHPGSLAPQINVTNPGVNYTAPPTVVISGGTGVGATGFATIVNGEVTKVTLSNPGNGYSPFDGPALSIALNTATHALATATATVGGGGVLGVTITNGGTGYTSQPTVTFSGGGGSGATGVAAGSNDTITEVVMSTPGTGYTSTPTVTFSAPATGPTATGIAQVSLNGISSITLGSGGAGYTSTPTVSIFDQFGQGFGAVALATISAGVVTALTLVNPGENYISPVVQFIGGNPATATATIELMPQGGQQPISGAAIQVFKNRVWMVNKTFRYTSAAGDLANFSASAGGVIAQNTDNFLIYNLLGLAQSSGFLYEFGDSSTNAISNPTTTTTNNVPSTNYTVTNVDPQIGCIWPGTIQPFGEAIIFAQPTGIYGLYGSSIRKISTDLDDLFNNIPVQPQLPTACTVTLFGIKCYCIALLIIDPYRNIPRQLLLLWDGFRWFAALQHANIVSVVTVGVGGAFSAYGSDGSNIYQLFSTPSTLIQKKLISKFYGATSALKAKRAMRFYLTAEQPMTYDVVVHSELGDVDLGPLAYPNPGVIGPSPPFAYGRQFAVQYQDALGTWGHYLGWTLTTNVAANNIDYMALAWLPDAPAF